MESVDASPELLVGPSLESANSLKPVQSDAEQAKSLRVAASAETESLEEQLREERDRYLRALAEFANYRRRAESDFAHAAIVGKRDLVLSLLEVADNFELALRYIADGGDSILGGVQAIYRQLMAVLENHGVTPIESLGRPFNPEFQEAIAVVEDGTCKPGMVTKEVRRGYLWGDSLLRAAQVYVSK